MASSFARKFRERCESAAQEMTGRLLDERPLTPDEEGAFAFFLSDELAHFFFDSMKFCLTDEDGERWLKKVMATRRGKKSGDNRFEKSLKLKFLQWAIEEQARNPALSKNAIAKRYADEHPEVSAQTLRRYLTQIGPEGVD